MNLFEETQGVPQPHVAERENARTPRAFEEGIGWTRANVRASGRVQTTNPIQAYPKANHRTNEETSKFYQGLRQTCIHS